MSDPYLLHIFSPARHVSPFDVNMAYEARFDHVVPYAGVELDDVRALTQDTIFSRGPRGVRRTAIFVGGRDLMLALDMFDAAREAMVPPFEVSVCVDPSGAITTAAALVAEVEGQLAAMGLGGLEGLTVHVFGGTGPVGMCAGLLAAQCGARVVLVSHLGREDAGRVVERLRERLRERLGVALEPADGAGEAAVIEAVRDTDVILATARAGVQVVPAQALAAAIRLKVVGDVNAVPPAGVAGVAARDRGRTLDAPTRPRSIGPLAVGDTKFRVHVALLEAMCAADGPHYLSYPQALEAARRIVSQRASSANEEEQ